MIVGEELSGASAVGAVPAFAITGLSKSRNRGARHWARSGHLGSLRAWHRTSRESIQGSLSPSPLDTSGARTHADEGSSPDPLYVHPGAFGVLVFTGAAYPRLRVRDRDGGERFVAPGRVDLYEETDAGGALGADHFGGGGLPARGGALGMVVQNPSASARPTPHAPDIDRTRRALRESGSYAARSARRPRLPVASGPAPCRAGRTLAALRFRGGRCCRNAR